MTLRELALRFPDIGILDLKNDRDIRITLAIARTNPRAAAEYAEEALRRVTVQDRPGGKIEEEHKL